MYVVTNLCFVNPLSLMMNNYYGFDHQKANATFMVNSYSGSLIDEYQTTLTWRAFTDGISLVD